MTSMEEHPAAARQSSVSVWRGRAFWGVAGLLWLVFGWWSFLTPSQAAVERVYSLGLYRSILGMLTPLTERLPFSLSLLLLGTLLAGFPLLWIGMWVYLRRVKKQSRWRGLFWGLKGLALLVPLLWFWFWLFWGAGYQRLPLEERLALDTEAITAEEAAELREHLLAVVVANEPEGERDAEGAVASIAAAMAAIVEDWDGRPARMPRRVKKTPKGLLLLDSTSGVCLPFALEAHVDGALPDTAYVRVAAHELGHIAGLCGEAEATCIGFVAGLRADHPYARYACAYDAYLDLIGQLPKDERKAAFEMLPETAQEDYRRMRETADAYRIDWFSKIGRGVYNKYLQSQGIKEGVKNYSRGISLFTFAWRKGLVQLPTTS